MTYTLCRTQQLIWSLLRQGFKNHNNIEGLSQYLQMDLQNVNFDKVLLFTFFKDENSFGSFTELLFSPSKYIWFIATSISFYLLCLLLDVKDWKIRSLCLNTFAGISSDLWISCVRSLLWSNIFVMWQEVSNW